MVVRAISKLPVSPIFPSLNFGLENCITPPFRQVIRNEFFVPKKIGTVQMATLYKNMGQVKNKNILPRQRFDRFM